jgi:hypothetical protein
MRENPASYRILETTPKISYIPIASKLFPRTRREHDVDPDLKQEVTWRVPIGAVTGTDSRHLDVNSGIGSYWVRAKAEMDTTNELFGPEDVAARDKRPNKCR